VPVPASNRRALQRGCHPSSDTALSGWDRQIESAFLQQRVGNELEVGHDGGCWLRRPHGPVQKSARGALANASMMGHDPISRHNAILRRNGAEPLRADQISRRSRIGMRQVARQLSSPGTYSCSARRERFVPLGHVPECARHGRRGGCRPLFGSDRGAVLCGCRMRGVQPPIALLDSAGALVPGNSHANVVRANPFTVR
jgi:hypothetical protein